MNTVIHAKLVSAITRYDIRQSKGKYYNPNALGLMFEALDRMEASMRPEETIEAALNRCFNDRLLTALLKAVK